MTIRILCVCLGNICRSPAAEAALRARLGPGAVIDSAGTGDWHVGKPPHGPMIAAAARRGLDLSDQRARQVGPADFQAFDLILAMDAQNLRDLAAMRPPGHAGATARLAPFLAPLASGPDDVPDPYFTRDFEAALDLIEAGAQAWADQPQIRSAARPKAT